MFDRILYGSDSAFREPLVVKPKTGPGTIEVQFDGLVVDGGARIPLKIRTFISSRTLEW